METRTVRISAEEVPALMREYPRGRIEWHEDGTVYASIPEAVYHAAREDEH